jgi:hypothetical protein
MVQVLGRDAAPINVSRAGKTITAATPEDSRAARYPASVWPSLALAPDGRLALAWQDNRSDPDPLWTGATGVGDSTDPDDWQILVATRGAAGWSAPVALGAVERADRHPSVAFSARGTLIAAWDSKELRASGANLAVLWAHSTDGGATWSAPAAIADAPAAMSQFPRLGNGPNGNVRAVWYDSRSADWRWRVMTALFARDRFGDARLILSRGNNSWPATSGGAIAFASTRNARRVQRDRTQQIYVLFPPPLAGEGGALPSP